MPTRANLSILHFSPQWINMDESWDQNNFRNETPDSTNPSFDIFDVCTVEHSRGKN